MASMEYIFISLEISRKDALLQAHTIILIIKITGVHLVSKDTWETLVIFKQIPSVVPIFASLIN